MAQRVLTQRCGLWLKVTQSSAANFLTGQDQGLSRSSKGHMMPRVTASLGNIWVRQGKLTWYGLGCGRGNRHGIAMAGEGAVDPVRPWLWRKQLTVCGMDGTEVVDPVWSWVSKGVSDTLGPRVLASLASDGRSFHAAVGLRPVLPGPLPGALSIRGQQQLGLWSWLLLARPSGRKETQ